MLWNPFDDIVPKAVKAAKESADEKAQATPQNVVKPKKYVLTFV